MDMNSRFFTGEEEQSKLPVTNDRRCHVETLADELAKAVILPGEIWQQVVERHVLPAFDFSYRSQEFVLVFGAEHERLVDRAGTPIPAPAPFRCAHNRFTSPTPQTGAPL